MFVQDIRNNVWIIFRSIVVRRHTLALSTSILELSVDYSMTVKLPYCTVFELKSWSCLDDLDSFHAAGKTPAIAPATLLTSSTSVVVVFCVEVGLFRHNSSITAAAVIAANAKQPASQPASELRERQTGRELSMQAGNGRRRLFALTCVQFIVLFGRMKLITFPHRPVLTTVFEINDRFSCLSFLFL
ncbi:hypothetical protein T4D_316 [Trichinella pseudospiralis]|uniref:Uncharacterized protein n=1 Tax=Trichinella pseudospiralis TaxID=6337 RepID=A0A0V1FCK0_TRIPS|nr:hypothetical protein T4D_316 [Trichinella pseudospiralis]